MDASSLAGIAVCVAVAGFVALLVGWQSRRATAARADASAWRTSLAGRLELESLYFLGDALRGRLDGAPIAIERNLEQRTIVVDVEGADERIGLATSTTATIPGFTSIGSTGELEPLLAALSPETRRLLHEVVVRRSGWVEFGHVRLRLGIEERISDQADAIRDAAALAVRLRRVGSPENVLSERACRDENAEVREAMLRRLLEVYAELPVTAAALRHARDDESPRIRRLARLASQETRATTLDEDPASCAALAVSLPAGLRERMISSLADAGAAAEPALLAVLRRPELGWPEDASRIARLTDGRVGEREAALVAAVRALGIVGTPASLAPLQNLARENPLGGGQVAAAVAKAISAIREQHPDLGEGQLALSDAPARAGALSEAAQPGALSPAELSRRKTTEQR